MAKPFSPEFQASQLAPGRSTAGAIVGLASSWVVGGFLILRMVEVEPGTSDLSDLQFALAMLLPLSVGAIACLNRWVRYTAGAALPGVVAGWAFGCLTLAGLFALSLIR